MSGFKNMTVMVDFVSNKDIYIYTDENMKQKKKKE
jgi:hypothetical protein